MAGIDIFAWVVFITILVVALLIFVILGMLPGKVARERSHPQAQAIQVASWVFLILGFAVWPFVLAWAYMRPIARPLDSGGSGVGGGTGAPDPRVAEHATQIAELTTRLAEVEARHARIVEAATEGGEAQ